jgi:hypothetical protein
MPAAHPNRAKVEAALAEVDRIAGGVNERLQAEERAALIVDAWDLIDRECASAMQESSPVPRRCCVSVLTAQTQRGTCIAGVAGVAFSRSVAPRLHCTPFVAGTIPDLVQPQRQLVLDLPEVDLTFPHSVDKGGFAEVSTGRRAHRVGSLIYC